MMPTRMNEKGDARIGAAWRNHLGDYCVPFSSKSYYISKLSQLVSTLSPKAPIGRLLDNFFVRIFILEQELQGHTCNLLIARIVE